jgi:protein FRA10AC1
MSSTQPRELKNVVCPADHAVLQAEYTFLPSEEAPASWQARMAQRYHSGLYKEFALADLSRPGQLGLRWRTKQEVVDGRGELSCGNLQCRNSENLVTIEVPFSYTEKGVAKKELVKLRLCSNCQPLVRAMKRPRKDEEDYSSSCDRSEESRERKKKDGTRHGKRNSSDSSSESSEESRKRKKRKHKHRKKKTNGRDNKQYEN